MSGGVNVARNQGVKLSLCDWVVFLDDDDELLPNAISLVGESIKGISDNYNVAYFNSLILRGGGEFEGGFQFKNLKKNLDFYDPTYEETLTKFNLKGDCKPALKKTLFDNEKYLFPESVNGFESYTMNIIAKDKKGIRYYNSIITKIHQEDELKDRLSISASAKNPWPLFVLHFKQIFQHFRFYISHPLFFLKKLKEMLKLFVRSVLKFFGF